MSSMPTFKLQTIKFEKDKDKKQFVLDCIVIATAISILYVAINEKFTEGVKSLHKNKHRKNVKQIQEGYEYLRSKQLFLYDIISEKDLATIKYKTQEKALIAFVQNISQTDQDVFLEYIAISIIDKGLNGLHRKTKLHPYLKNFLDYKILYEKIGSNIETVGGEMEIEHKLAENFVKNLKY